MHRKVTVRQLCDDLEVTVRIFTLSLVPRKSYGGLKASLWWPYGDFVVAGTTVRGPYNRRTAASRAPWGHITVFWSRESYDHRQVAVTFVTTSTAARKTLRFLRITVTNRRPQIPTATVRRQHGMWPRHNLKVWLVRFHKQADKFKLWRSVLHCWISPGASRMYETNVDQ